MISEENIDSILKTVMISVMSRRKIYLSEISRGMELCGFYDELTANAERKSMKCLVLI